MVKPTHGHHFPWCARGALCLLLGLFSSWLVAWGIAVGWWIGWFGRPTGTGGRGCFLSESLLVEVYQFHEHGQSRTLWFVTRADRDEWFRDSAMERIDRMHGNDRLAMQDPSSVLPSEVSTLHHLAATFPDRPEARRVDDHSLVTIELISYGWPMRCVSETVVSRHTFAAGALGRRASNVTREQYWLWNTHIPHRSAGAGFVPPDLMLPIRPLPVGWMLNTLFYGLVWALPLIAVPLVQRVRRRRRGLCDACAYDLAGAASAACPECGQPLRGV